MPELPEVETIRRGLEQTIKTQKIVMAKVNRADLRFPLPSNLKKVVINHNITCIERRSKYLLFQLSNGYTMLSHLGMSGKWLYYPATRNRTGKHDHIELIFENKSELIYNDPRRFGMLDITPAEKLSEHPLIRDLGPEPLHQAFDANALFTRISGRKVAIKQALMNSHIVVGVGNIYANEALFTAGIDPRTPCHKLDMHQINRLVKSLKNILNAAIASGGSTLRDYVRSSGDVGHFQHHFKVYGRAGEPCETCGTLIEKIQQQGRSTFFCPTCQR